MTNVATALRHWPKDRQAHAFLRAFDAIEAGVLVLDSQNTVLFANSRACVVFGRSAGSLEGQPLSAIIGPLDGPLVDASETLPGRRQREVVLPSGRRLQMGFTVSSLTTDDEIGSVVLFQDITPKRQIQKERDLLLKLSAVGDAMPTVLHELRNPLSAVLSALEVLMDERGEDSPLLGELKLIENEVRRALLGLEGLGLGTRALRSASADPVDEAIRNVCQVLAPRAKRSGVALEVSVAPLPPLYLDASALRAVVYNLVTNAMHACASGATVRVKAGIEPATGDFELLVEDTGAGMPPEVLARCTELFFTTKRSGSGIGLALCRELVSRGGGELEIHSSPDVGTRVRITVPVPDRRPSHPAL